MLDDGALSALAQQLDQARGEQVAAALRMLREEQSDFASHLPLLYARCKRADARRACVFFGIRYARVNQAVFEMGIAALRDRATLVRYRACGLLAYALREEAIAALTTVLEHHDRQTADDAAAGIDAIVHQNHHYFLDRKHSGLAFWEVES